MGFEFKLKDAENAALASFRFARWGGGSNDLNIDMSGLYGGHNSNKPIATRYTLFDITVNYATRTITSVVYCNNTDGKGSTAEKTFTANLSKTNPIAKFEIAGYNVGGNTDRANIFDDLVITTTEGDYSVTTYDYTVNWVYNNETIKTATRQGENGASISLFDTDKTTFWENSKKYFYVSDDASTKTVSTDGSTVVTINVRPAGTWNYTVNAIDESDNILGEITSNTVVEGEDIYYYYPTFYLNGTSLLQSDINDKTYGKRATPTVDNAVYSVVYKDKSISDIVFYKECEDIEGFNATTAGNVPARCSNGKGAYATSEVTITTLSAGKYKISGFAWGNSGTNFHLKVGEETVATFTTASSTVNVSTSDEFTLSSTSTITMEAQGNAGSSPKVIDFIYIQKTGDYTETKEITSAGYATYCSENALNFEGTGLTAYIAQKNGETIEFTQVNQVPANTGVLLKGNEGSYNIPAIASAAAVENALVGVTAATEQPVGIFVLMDGTKGVGFYKTTGNFTVGANTAYLPASVAEGRTFIGFDDDEQTTGIQAVNSEKITMNGGIYNLNGQRVEKATKGLYIVNGKKTVKN